MALVTLTDGTVLLTGRLFKTLSTGATRVTPVAEWTDADAADVAIWFEDPDAPAGVDRALRARRMPGGRFALRITPDLRRKHASLDVVARTASGSPIALLGETRIKLADPDDSLGIVLNVHDHDPSTLTRRVVVGAIRRRGGTPLVSPSGGRPMWIVPHVNTQWDTSTDVSPVGGHSAQLLPTETSAIFSLSLPTTVTVGEATFDTDELEFDLKIGSTPASEFDDPDATRIPLGRVSGLGEAAEIGFVVPGVGWQDGDGVLRLWPGPSEYDRLHAVLATVFPPGWGGTVVDGAWQSSLDDAAQSRFRDLVRRQARRLDIRPRVVWQYALARQRAAALNEIFTSTYEQFFGEVVDGDIEDYLESIEDEMLDFWSEALFGLARVGVMLTPSSLARQSIPRLVKRLASAGAQHVVSRSLFGQHIAGADSMDTEPESLTPALAAFRFMMQVVRAGTLTARSRGVFHRDVDSNIVDSDIRSILGKLRNAIAQYPDAVINGRYGWSTWIPDSVPEMSEAAIISARRIARARQEAEVLAGSEGDAARLLIAAYETAHGSANLTSPWLHHWVATKTPAQLFSILVTTPGSAVNADFTRVSAARRRFEMAYPNDFLAAWLLATPSAGSTDPGPGLLVTGLDTEVQTTLAAALVLLDPDDWRADVDDVTGPAAFSNSAAAAFIRKIQRIMKLAPPVLRVETAAEVIKCLDERDLHVSAEGIAFLSEEVFVADLTPRLMALWNDRWDAASGLAWGDPGAGQTVPDAESQENALAKLAREIYGRAKRYRAARMTADVRSATEQLPATPGGGAAMLKSVGAAHATTAVLTSGAIPWSRDATGYAAASFAETTPSDSIFGPAAYYYDLLAFADGQDLLSTLKGTLDAPLEERRPDLVDLELLRPNAETALPALDLVIEVLERRTRLLAESMGLGPALTVDERLPTLTIGAAADLRLEPEHTPSRSEVDAVLSAATYPRAANVQTAAQEMAALLERENLQRSDLMEWLRPVAALSVSPGPAWPPGDDEGHRGVAEFGLSAADVAMLRGVSVDAVTPADRGLALVQWVGAYLGAATEETETVAAALAWLDGATPLEGWSSVRRLGSALDCSLDDLRSLLRSRFVNPNLVLDIGPLGATGDLDAWFVAAGAHIGVTSAFTGGGSTVTCTLHAGKSRFLTLDGFVTYPSSNVQFVFTRGTEPLILDLWFDPDATTVVEITERETGDPVLDPKRLATLTVPPTGSTDPITLRSTPTGLHLAQALRMSILQRATDASYAELDLLLHALLDTNELSGAVPWSVLPGDPAPASPMVEGVLARLFDAERMRRVLGLGWSDVAVLCGGWNGFGSWDGASAFDDTHYSKTFLATEGLIADPTQHPLRLDTTYRALAVESGTPPTLRSAGAFLAAGLRLSGTEWQAIEAALSPSTPTASGWLPPDSLTLANVTTLARTVLLARSIGLQLHEFLAIAIVFPPPPGAEEGAEGRVRPRLFLDWFERARPLASLRHSEATWRPLLSTDDTGIAEISFSALVTVVLTLRRLFLEAIAPVATQARTSFDGGMTPGTIERLQSDMGSFLLDVNVGAPWSGVHVAPEALFAALADSESVASEAFEEVVRATVEGGTAGPGTEPPAFPWIVRDEVNFASWSSWRTAVTTAANAAANASARRDVYVDALMVLVDQYSLGLGGAWQQFGVAEEWANRSRSEPTALSSLAPIVGSLLSRGVLADMPFDQIPTSATAWTSLGDEFIGLALRPGIPGWAAGWGGWRFALPAGPGPMSPLQAAKLRRDDLVAAYDGHSEEVARFTAALETAPWLASTPTDLGDMHFPFLDGFDGWHEWVAALTSADEPFVDPEGENRPTAIPLVLVRTMMLVFGLVPHIMRPVLTAEISKWTGAPEAWVDAVLLGMRAQGPARPPSSEPTDLGIGPAHSRWSAMADWTHPALISSLFADSDGEGGGGGTGGEGGEGGGEGGDEDDGAISITWMLTHLARTWKFRQLQLALGVEDDRVPYLTRVTARRLVEAAEPPELPVADELHPIMELGCIHPDAVPVSVSSLDVETLPDETNAFMDSALPRIERTLLLKAVDDALPGGTPIDEVHAFRLARVTALLAVPGAHPDLTDVPPDAVGGEAASAAHMLALRFGWHSAGIADFFGDTGLAVSELVLSATSGPDAMVDLITRLASLHSHTVRLGIAPEGWLPTRVPTVTTAAVEAFRGSLRRAYDPTAWQSVYAPIADGLRVARRDAMVAWILHHQEEWKTVADLHAALLVDPLLGPAETTTRLLFATASVQTYLHRVAIGLEAGSNLAPKAQDAWTLLRLYRVWEAARRVFVYPENWIEPELRVDATPLFETFEKDLARDDLDDDVLQGAVEAYLRSLEKLSRLRVVSHYRSPGQILGEPYALHVLAATPAPTPKFWYRRRDGWGEWGSWEEVPHEVDAFTGAVAHVRGRTYIGWLVVEDRGPVSSADGTSDPDRPTRRSYNVRVRLLERGRDGWAEAPVEGVALGRTGAGAPQLTSSDVVLQMREDDADGRRELALEAWRIVGDPNEYGGATVTPAGEESYTDFGRPNSEIGRRIATWYLRAGSLAVNSARYRNDMAYIPNPSGMVNSGSAWTPGFLPEGQSDKSVISEENLAAVRARTVRAETSTLQLVDSDGKWVSVLDLPNGNVDRSPYLVVPEQASRIAASGPTWFFQDGDHSYLVERFRPSYRFDKVVSGVEDPHIVFRPPDYGDRTPAEPEIPSVDIPPPRYEVEHQTPSMTGADEDGLYPNGRR